MCGICGYIGLQSEKLLEQMTNLLAHRGPDDKGIYLYDSVGLGHRRLSIIDISERGHQPMFNHDRSLVIVYNGELYNYREIRSDLEKTGVTLQSNSDTEVVLYAYQLWGEACLQRFNGMFAFAIWSHTKKEMFLVRDRIGVKPMYYCLHNNIFLFASEIKTILCCPQIPRQVNARALDYYLTLRYNPLDETLFENIYKLPPASFMRVHQGTTQDIDISIQTYWNLTYQPPQNNEDILYEVKSRLKQAVDTHLISDAPLGVFLSSGIDSNTITGIMRKNNVRKIQTFTVGFDYSGFEDELIPARHTSRILDTEHTEYLCRPDVVSELPRIVFHMDELNGDPALLPIYFLSRIARQKVKVVLSGEGGDEIFGGYERSIILRYLWQFNHIARLGSPFVPFSTTVLQKAGMNHASLVNEEELQRLGQCFKQPKNITKNFLHLSAVFSEEEKKKLYRETLLDQMEHEDIGETLYTNYFKDMSYNNVNEMFFQYTNFEIKTRLVNDLLHKLDTMSMAHSLEGRVPYLDHTLVEYASSLPVNYKINGLKNKLVLRQTAQHYLPKEILNRKKSHFFVPIHLWLDNELRYVIESLFSPEFQWLEAYIDRNYLLSIYTNYARGSYSYSRQLWNVLLFVVWHKIYIETDLFLTMPEYSPNLYELLFWEN